MFVFDDDVDDDVDDDDDDVQRTTNTILTTTKFVFSCFRLCWLLKRKKKDREGQRTRASNESCHKYTRTLSCSFLIFEDERR